MFFCSECGKYFMDGDMGPFYCNECTDWINQAWVEEDDTPSLLVRFADGNVVCAYKEVSAVIKDYDLPNYAPYDWLKQQIDTNELLSGFHLDPSREYAFQLDGLVDAILLDVLSRDRRASEYFDTIDFSALEISQ